MAEGQKLLELGEAMAALPLVAILRGVKPDEVLDIGFALVEAGFRLIEVPLNSPDPFRSIELLASHLGGEALIGGGTVLTPDRARRVVGAGGGLVVMPHCDAEIIRAARMAGAACIPGIATPTEAFVAVQASADALKLFPAEIVTPAAVRALRAVLPPNLPLLPVGGIAPETMADYVAAGANGFGIGSALYKPGCSADEVRRRAEPFVTAWRAIAC